MYKFRITVFTPTYNRAYIIDRLYESLCEQTYRNFEWLVIDDGSVDQTEEIFDTWMKKADFSIRYYKTKNGGKHRAINQGLDLAEGEIFFTVDSDDQLTKEALDKVNNWFYEIESKSDICGIVANRGITPTKTVNAFFERRYLDKSLADMDTYCEAGKKVLGGERAIAIYTDLHKNYRFPEFPGEKFMPEEVVYNRISKDGYLMRFFNDIIVLSEYQPDGLTNAGSSIYLNNPKGYGLWIKEKIIINKYSITKRLKTYYGFICDLAPLYNCKMIAESINLPTIVVDILYFLHFLRMKIKGKKKNE